MALYIDRERKKLGGVIAGFSTATGASVTLLRVVFVVLFFFSYGSLFFLYILFWIFLPIKPVTPGTTTTVIITEKEFLKSGGVTMLNPDEVIKMKCASCGFLNNVRRGDTSKVCVACDNALT